MTETNSTSAPAAKSTGIDLKRIMVPTDFSEASRQALPVAAELATQFGASITLAHVFPATLPAEWSHLGILFEQKRLTAETREQLARFREQVLPATLPVETRVLEGGPANEIAKLAIDSAADLIIMATHGRTGLKHFWLGSTAEHVIRYAPCPVLVVRDRPTTSRFPGEGVGRFLRILVPVDFSEASRSALPYAAAFAQSCGGEVTLIHVLEPPPYPEFGYARIPTKEARLKQAAHVQLESLCRELAANGIKALSVIRTGNSFREITEAAREQSTD